jgi:hypothetical protein
MRRRRPIKVKGISEPRHTLEIGSLLPVLATRQSDTVLRLIEMRIAEPWTRAHALERPEPRPVLPEQVVRQLAQSMDNTDVFDLDGSGASWHILAVLMPFVFRPSLLCERRRPFCLPRRTTAPTAATERELPLANAMGKLDAGDRDGRVRKRLEPGQRRAASLYGAMVLLDEVVEILCDTRSLGKLSPR